MGKWMGLIVLLALVLVASVAQASDVKLLAGAYHERSESSLAVGVRINIPQLPDKLQVIGLYAVAPVFTTDGSTSTLALDQLNMRFGPGVHIGQVGSAQIDVALCWKLSTQTEDLRNPGIFAALVF